MSRPDRRPRSVRPVPVPRAARELIRRIDPEHATAPKPAPSRRFQLDDVEWIARVTGEVLGGSGTHGTVALAVVQFFRAEAPDAPLREALLPPGRFEALFDEELQDLCRTARAVESQE